MGMKVHNRLFFFSHLSSDSLYCYKSNGCKYILTSVSKAQHGCIDCLALMICAELQAPESFASTSEKSSVLGKKGGTSWFLILSSRIYISV
jgi:hypothetical protein